MGSWLSSYYPLLNLHRPWQSSGLENEFQLTDGDFQGVNLPKGSMKPSILVDDSDPWLGSERLHRNLFWLSDGRKFPQCVGIVRLETNCRTQPAGGDKKSIWTTCQYAKMPIMCMYGMYVCIYIYVYIHQCIYILAIICHYMYQTTSTPSIIQRDGKDSRLLNIAKFL
jgi:hypothetical protein